MHINVLWCCILMLVNPFLVGLCISVACCLFFTNPLPFFPMQPASSSNLPLTWNGYECVGKPIIIVHIAYYFLQFIYLKVNVMDMFFFKLSHLSDEYDWKKKKPRMSICHPSRFTVKQGVDWFFPWLLLCGRLVILLFLVRSTDNKSQSAK